MNGGGIACVAGAAPIIDGNFIGASGGNTATNNGGGIYSSASFPTIGVGGANTISNNVATNGNGGGIAWVGPDPGVSPPAISNNTITDNAAPGASPGGNGGGIACWGATYVTITGNTIGAVDVGNAAASDGGGIWISGTGTNPSVRGNPIIDCNTAGGNGGGIACVAEATPTIDGNTIGAGVGNTAKIHGGGIYISASNPNIGGGGANTISTNVATNGNGGGIACVGSDPAAGPPTISGNMIIFNTAPGVPPQGNGGGIACWGATCVTITGNTVGITPVGNNAASDGGGIWISGLSTNPSVSANPRIDSNIAGGNGGGIACVAKAAPAIKNNTIGAGGGNLATTNGGGIYISTSNPNIGGGGANTISNNLATNGNGGGIACMGPDPAAGPPTISGNTIILNMAPGAPPGGNGGGIACWGATCGTITGNTVGMVAAGNIAASDGGGIWISGPGTNPSVSGNPMIDSNTAGGNGGGVACAAGANPPLIKDNNIGVGGGNSATTGDGGGIWCSGPGTNPTIDGNVIEHPIVKGSDYVVDFSSDGRLDRIDIASVDFDGKSTVKFDYLGSPYNEDNGALNSGTITLQAGGSTKTVTVEPVTGFISVSD